MSMNTDITQNQKATIHILLNKYSIKDEQYRKILFDKYEVYSCCNLTEEQAEELIHHLNYNNSFEYKLGFNSALNRMLDSSNVSLLTQFTRLNKNATECEIKLFNMLTEEQQQQVIKGLLVG